jgi:hypothetical protein
LAVAFVCLSGFHGGSRVIAASETEHQDRAAKPRFSHGRGFYSALFDVTITCQTPEATIYYTLDGSEPGSPAAKAYGGPLRITRTTCLRAQALRAGWASSPVATHTYIFLDDVIARAQSQVIAQGYPDTWFGGSPADYGMDPEVCYDPAYADRMDDALLAIPTVSLVTNKDYLFSHSPDPQTGGVYIYTGHSSTGGSGWERPISVELLTADGSKEFQVNCGLQIQGDESRDPLKCPKHSFSLRLDGKYGPARLDYPLFDGSPVQSFDSLQLQGFFDNSWLHWATDQRRRAQYLRDQWMRDSLLEMGHADAGKGLYVHLYLNGIYWGLYNLHEQVDAGHYARYHGGDPKRLDATEGDPTYIGPEPGRSLGGTLDTWLELQNIVASRDWDRTCSVLDVDSFIDWSILNGLAGTQGLQRGRKWRSAGGGPDRSPWRFYSWDAERAMESINHNTVNPDSDPTGLLNYLDDIEEFRVRFGDRVHKHLFHGGVLSPDRNAERWIRRANEIELAVIAESARWGDYRRDVHPYEWGPFHLYTRDAFWTPAKNRLLDEYFPRRTDIALAQFKSRGLYPGTDAPTFHVDGIPRHGGSVTFGSRLSMQAASGAIWYTLDGSDPRRPAQAARVVAVHTLVPEDAAKRVLVPTQAVDESWKGGAPFNDSFWTLSTGAPGGVGYDRTEGYDPLISLDTEDRMFAQNRTCYIRIPFQVAVDPGRFDHLMLRARYDDGFVAYLNGVEILRVVFQGTPTWDSGAGGTHEADDVELFAVSGGLAWLRRGDNVLAIHGMNSATDSPDFIISAALEAVETTAISGSDPSATAIQYKGSITMNGAAQVRTRTLNGSEWSALNEAVFVVGAADRQ